MLAMPTHSNITVPQKYTEKYKNVGYGWDTSHPATISKKVIILIYHYLHTVSILLPYHSLPIDPSEVKTKHRPHTRTAPDKANTCYCPSIGVTKSNLVNNLSIIAQSNRNQPEPGTLLSGTNISIGFYSVYLVAERVDVTIKHKDDDIKPKPRKTICESFESEINAGLNKA